MVQLFLWKGNVKIAYNFETNPNDSHEKFETSQPKSVIFRAPEWGLFHFSHDKKIHAFQMVVS